MKKKKSNVHPWRPPFPDALLRREPVVCTPRGKIGTWCNIFANTVFGKHFDESDNGYTEKAGDVSVLGDLYKLYILQYPFNHRIIISQHLKIVKIFETLGY